MKKILSAALCAAMLTASLTVASSAAWIIDNGSNIKNVTTTIAGVSKNKPVLDGKISKNEYKEIAYTDDDLRVAGIDQTQYDNCQELAKSLKLYAAYSEDTMYVAVVINTPDYAQTESASNMWKMHSLQIGAARGDVTSASEHSEIGFARNSETDELMYVLWTDNLKSGWQADTTGKDFVCVTENGVTTYEIALPASVFGMDSFEKGDTVRLNFCLNIATAESARGTVEWSNGVAVDKDGTTYALVTLGDPIVVESTAAAAQTADPITLTVIASISAASMAVATKRKKK